jgi:hypothetical protein
VTIRLHIDNITYTYTSIYTTSKHVSSTNEKFYADVVKYQRTLARIQIKSQVMTRTEEPPIKMRKSNITNLYDISRVA